MKYIKSNELDPVNTFFHFTRIDNRKSIEKNGLQAVAGGENEAIGDKNNKTIYFSKGIVGVLKAVDVWARWEYHRYSRQANNEGGNIKQEYENHIVTGEDNSYDKKVMSQKIFDTLYTDFKNRQYYTMDLIEGNNGDFEFDDIDSKKISSRDKDGRPFPGALWKYGPYSDFGTVESPNNKQEDWNMNTKIGERTISSERLRIVETEKGKTDALSFILEAYDKYRDELSNEQDGMFEILDNFMAYAKERYKSDRDFKDGAFDYGRRKIDSKEERKYQGTNKIKINETRRNGLFNFITKISNKLKSIGKSKDFKRLPETSDGGKEETPVNPDLKNNFLESIEKEVEWNISQQPMPPKNVEPPKKDEPNI